MKKTIVGVISALALAVLSYTALASFDRSHASAPAQVAVKRSPAEIAARDRMAQLVAEVAARSAAQTAKAVVMNRMQSPPQPVNTTEEKTASR